MAEKTNLKSSALISLFLLAVLTGSVRAGGTYSGGDGSAENPYRIATPNDLNDIGNHPEDFNDCFILVNNINMAGFTYTTALIAPDIDNSTSNFQGTPFTGIFDGNDCNICNLTIDTAGAGNDYLGLFGKIDGLNAQVMNLGIEDVDIIGRSASHFLGGLVGYSNYGTISGCYATGNVSGNNNSYFRAGLCGINWRGIISNCYAIASVAGGTESVYFGGLCGENYYGTISNCYAKGSVTVEGSSDWIGGLCGTSTGIILNCYATGNIIVGGESKGIGGLCGGSGGAISNCYAMGSVASGNNCDYIAGLCGSNGGSISACYATGTVTAGSGYEFLGGLCGKNNNVISSCFWNTETSGLDISDGGIGLTTVQMQTESTFTDAGWDFLGEMTNGTSDFWVIEPNQYPELTVLSDNFVPYVFSNGSGTESDPYEIHNIHDIEAIWQYPQACFMLNTDIDLSSIEWIIAVIPVSFTGRFDGNGFRILNFSISGGHYFGLFAHIGPGGEVKNLGIENVTIMGADGSEWFGGLCGYSHKATIANCYVTGSITSGDNSGYLGGLCGYNYQGIITNCYVIGSVSSGEFSKRLGGLCGNNYDGIITNCNATVTITGENYSDYFGGLCGYNYEGTISNCYATGSVSGYRTVGGLCGWNRWGTIFDCYATGDVQGNDYLGGLCGDNYGSIGNCYAASEVSGASNVGALVGHDYTGSYTSCFWDSNVAPDVNGIGNTTDPNVTGKTTAEMQTESTFTDAGWDFVDIWEICEGTNYPKLTWQIPVLGDFVCPDGVDWNDVDVLSEQWLLEELSWDVWPNDGDGIVNFFDWGVFADGWQVTNDFDDLAVFADQWLKTGSNYYIADIAPPPEGDGIVDFRDFAAQAANWLAGK